MFKFLGRMIYLLVAILLVLNRKLKHDKMKKWLNNNFKYHCN